jgi:chaperone required for assembly of F1-ATPase
MINISRLLKHNFSTEGAFQNLKIFKKFYKKASVEINPSPGHPLHKYTVKLDGKSIKTPNMHVFGVPS